MKFSIASVATVSASLGYMVSGIAQLAYNIAMDLRDSFTRRIGFIGTGIFIHLPFTPRSIWVEWREQSVGLGFDRTDPENLEFFVGRIQGVLSVERVWP